MRSSSKFLAGLVCAAALGFAPVSSAAIYTVTFGGTVIEGTDDTGVFGLPGTLAGEAFTAVFTYDTSHFRTTDPGVSDEVLDIAASLRIKGVTHVLPDVEVLTSYAFAEVGEWTLEHFTAVDADPVDLRSLFVNVFSPALAPNLDTPPTSGPIDGTGSFSIFSCCCPSCQPSFEDQFAGGRLDIDFIHFAVPEPTTWALTITGFGLVGAGLRRRRRAAA